MKIYIRFFVFFVILGFSCSASPESSETSSDSSKTPAVSKTVEASVEPQFALPPRIPIPTDKKVLEIENGNFDEDPEEEQILFLQSKSNLSLPITIQIIDYDPKRKTSYLGWEGTALASANQPFTFAFEDLVGDHRLELIVRGLDEVGLPCMDVFRRFPAPGGIGFQYKSIFSISVPGRVDTVVQPRSASYDSGQKSDISFPIEVEAADPNGQNSLDTVKTTYGWKFQSSKYEVVKVEKYRRESQNDANLEKVFQGDNKTFEAFLAGSWYKEDQPNAKDRVILFIDPLKREIIFGTTSSQEVYDWGSTSRTLRNGVYVSGSNNLIPLIKLQASLAVTSSETLDANVQDSPNFTGTYKRLADSVLTSGLQKRSAPLVQAKGPAGQYKNDKGQEFHFELPYVTTMSPNGKQSGAAALFILDNKTILQMKLQGQTGKMLPSVNYAIEMKEEKTTSRVIRTLTLQRGSLTSEGWKSDMSEPIKLEQIEVLSDSSR